jgi:hypothetical protein
LPLLGIERISKSCFLPAVLCTPEWTHVMIETFLSSIHICPYM